MFWHQTHVYRHPVVESAAAVEGNQEPDTVSSRLWRRLGSGGSMGSGVGGVGVVGWARVHPEGALGWLQPR